jgi:Ca2+-binding EF-hand superfamily protein
MGPRPKPNPYKIMDTEEYKHINYLFDYLDEFLIKSQGKTLVQILTTEFKKIYEAALKLPKTAPNVEDCYTPEKLLFYYSNGAAGKEPFTDPRITEKRNAQEVKVVTPPANEDSNSSTKSNDDAVIFKTIQAFNKNFNAEIYKKSITPVQIKTLLDAWRWAPSPNNDIMFAKKLVDKYDFDGDGALNPMEFIVFSIRHNMKQVHQCKENCYKDIIDKIFDPLFMYLDCDNDGFINAENMWAGLKNINRQSKNFDIYACLFPVELNKSYRTNSVNDFILKHTHVADGFLNSQEFRTGLLLGYWERQVSENEITEGPDRTNKGTRWAASGSTDVECEKIKGFFPKSSGQFNQGLVQAKRRR